MAGSSDPFARPITKRPALLPPRLNSPLEKRVKTTHEPLIVKSGDPQRSVDEKAQDAEVRMNGDDLEGHDDDEDDRFFGGGLSKEQAQALDFLDANDQDADGPVVALDPAGVRTLAAQLERAITKNQHMRTRHAEDPIKFLDSEAELDKYIKELSVLSEYPNLFKEFVDMNCLASLVNIISHDNTDIACSAIQVIDELTDEETNADRDEAEVLLDGLRDCQALEILTQNLERLDESRDIEEEGVFRTLTIMENLVNIEPSLKIYLVEQLTLLPWLLDRLQKQEADVGISQNKQYTAEFLSVLVQDAEPNIQRLIDDDATDSILMLLAPYRKLTPDKNSLEEEYLENLFDILDTIVTRPSGKDKLLEGEGVELMQRLYVDSKSAISRRRALQVLEYGCASWSGGAVCAQVVEVGLLRSLFSTFMKKDDLEMVKVCLGIFVSFFRTLNDGEPERIRVINKFLENDFQKMIRLLDIRIQFDTRHREVLKGQARVDKSSMTGDDEIEYDLTKYLDRLDNGLDALQMIDTILAWLLATDHSARDFIHSRNQSIVEDIKMTLTEMLGSLKSKGESAADPVEADALGGAEEQRQECELLEALIGSIS